MKQSRRVLAVLLALVMVITIIPQNAMAAKNKSKKKKYTIEISYVYMNGKKAAKTYKKSYPAGKKKVKATVKVPKINGYKATMVKKQIKKARKSFTKFQFNGKKIKYQLNKAKKNIKIKVVYVKNKTQKTTKKKETEPSKPGKDTPEEDSTSVTDDSDTGVSAPAEGFKKTGNLKGTLKSSDNKTMSVDVDIPDGAFDVPVELKLGEASDEDKAKIEEHVGEYVDMALVDISFLDVDGNELEPKEGKSINVSIKTDELKEANSYTLYHINSAGEVEEVTPPEFDEPEVTESVTTFSSDRFSVYAIVAVEEDGSVNYQQTFGDSTVSIKAPAGAFPEGTQMKLSSVDPEKVVNIIAEKYPDQTYSFSGVNITFIKDGSEVEPKVPVSVVWESNSLSGENEKLVHILDDDSLETISDAKISDNRIKFTAESFSDYVTLRLAEFDLDVDGDGTAEVLFNPSILANTPTVDGKIVTQLKSGEVASTHPEFPEYIFKYAGVSAKDTNIPTHKEPDEYGNLVDVPDDANNVVYLGAMQYEGPSPDDQSKIIKTTYVYYRTKDQNSDLIVKLASDEQIQLVYASAPNKINYQVKYNGSSGTIYDLNADKSLPKELIDALGEDDANDLIVTGPSYVDSNAYQKAVSVNIPRGYTATVKIGSKTYELGKEPTYTVSDNAVITKNGELELYGIYDFPAITSEQTVLITLIKRTSFIFDASKFLSTKYTGGNSTVMGDSTVNNNSNARITSDGTLGTSGTNKGKKTFTDNEVKWTFTTNNTESSHWLLDSLQINGTDINVPYGDSGPVSKTTNLPSGAIVTVTLNSVTGSGRNARRNYTITVSNVYEDVVISGGNIYNADNSTEIITEVLKNVDYSFYGFSSSDNAFSRDVKAGWVDWKEGEPIGELTSGSPKDSGTYTMYWFGTDDGNRMRFSVKTGYENPKLAFVTSTEEDLHNYVKLGRGLSFGSMSDEDGKYYLINGNPDSSGNYYFYITGMGSNKLALLRIKAELAQYGVSYSVKPSGEAGPTAANATIPAYDEGGYYDKEKQNLRGYNQVDNDTVVIADSAPTDKTGEYSFLYYTIQGDTSGTQYAPSQKVDLKTIIKYATTTKNSYGEHEIPLVAHWKKKEQVQNVDVKVKIFVDDVDTEDVIVQVPKESAIYVDIDSSAMHNFMSKPEYNWQLFYDEMGSSPLIQRVTENNKEIEVRLYSKFYVYHSGTGRLELHTTKEAEIGEGDNRKIDTLDFSKYADSEFLYGGYYEDYGGAYKDGKNVVQAAADYDNNEGLLSTDDIRDLSNKKGIVINDSEGSENIGTHYDPQPDDNSWNWNKAYQESVRKPQRAKIYYVKEVPTGFLQNYIFYVYDRHSKKLASIYPMTAVDDKNYNEVGINFSKDLGAMHKLCKSIKFFNDNPDVETKILSATDDWKVGEIETTNVFSDRYVHNGYLAIWKDTTFAPQPNAEFTAQPYWTTPDGVHVDGIYTSTVNTGEHATSETITITNRKN